MISPPQKSKIQQEELYRAQLRKQLSQARKSRYVAAFLAFFLGSIGAHKFYLNKPLWGFIYFLFFWTMIPFVVSILEAIIYLATSESDFQSRFG
jgi:TM2 domain-containing membrane protein YozV